jgi:hypothetical protein
MPVTAAEDRGPLMHADIGMKRATASLIPSELRYP